MSEGTNLYDIFEDINVLQSREPNYFRFSNPIRVTLGDEFPYEITVDEKSPKVDIKEVACQSEENSMSVQTTKLPTVVKNAISILQEGCFRHYDGCTPKYQEQQLPLSPGLFAFTCEVREMKGLGIGLTKKSAKKNAAQEVLKLIIKKDRYKDFCLGSTVQEAYNFLDNLGARDSNQTVNGEHEENYVGKLNNLCQRSKWVGPSYSFPMKSQNEPFKTICQLRDLETIGEGRTKKLAKAMAAKKMWKAVMGNVESQPDIEING